MDIGMVRQGVLGDLELRTDMGVTLHPSPHLDSKGHFYANEPMVGSVSPSYTCSCPTSLSSAMTSTHETKSPQSTQSPGSHIKDVHRRTVRGNKSDGEVLNSPKSTPELDKRLSADDEAINGVLRKNEPYTPRLRYPDLTAQIFIHLGGLYGVYLIFTSCKLLTFLWAFCTLYTSAVGITAGVHRLWSHKAFKATLPLRVILMLLFTITGQRHIWAWVLDHRVHHRYSETDADPHDARRGFFFAHVGWLVVTPHPAVERARLAVDMSDLHQDGVVMWQKRWYEPLFALLVIAVPVLVPVYLWQESLWTSFWVNFNARFSATLNIAFLINSLAHTHGFRPYDKGISPVESPILGLLAIGEGWHNFHHVFPWDYRTGELGGGRINVTTLFIDLCAAIGWAYDLRAADGQVIRRRVQRCGDGTGGGLFGAGKRPEGEPEAESEGGHENELEYEFPETETAQL